MTSNKEIACGKERINILRAVWQRPGRRATLREKMFLIFRALSLKFLVTTSNRFLETWSAFRKHRIESLFLFYG
jgi:hypothetical protein